MRGQVRFRFWRGTPIFCFGDRQFRPVRQGFSIKWVGFDGANYTLDYLTQTLIRNEQVVAHFPSKTLMIYSDGFEIDEVEFSIEFSGYWNRFRRVDTNQTFFVYRSRCIGASEFVYRKNASSMDESAIIAVVLYTVVNV